MRTARLLVFVCALVLLGGALASTASAAPNLLGSWAHQETDFTQTGGNAGGYSGVSDEITVEDDSGAFSGTNDSESDPMMGNQQGAGGSLDFWVDRYHDPGSLSYEFFHGTLSDGGNVITGIGALCAAGATPQSTPRELIYQANFVMSLPGADAVPIPSSTAPGQAAAQALCDEALPAGPDFRHPTSTSVQCFLGATATANATCVATVADQGSPVETPSSAVNFTASGGSLPNGSQCSLAASTATAGSPGTCQITYTPPAGGLSAGSAVPLQATYIGDSDHKPSTAGPVTTVGGSAPPPSTIQPVQIPPAQILGPVTLAQCQDYGDDSANTNIPPGDYTGPNGQYGAKAQNAFSCSLLATLGDVAGGKWVTASLAATLESADAGDRFVQRFPTFIQTDNGYQEVDAQIHPWANSQNTAQQTGLHDPPAASYTTLAVARPVKLPLVRVTGNVKTRAATRALNSWLQAISRSRGLADAFTLTVNRAGGAKAAQNPTWEGRQTRLAITLSQQLSAQDTALIPLTRRIAALAASSPQAKRGLSAAALQRIRAKIARRGLTTTERRNLTKLGYDATQLAEVVTAARDTSVPTSALFATPAQALGNPALVTQLQTLALFFKLWPDRPEVLAAAALP